jgi:hypothetical protein
MKSLSIILSIVFIGCGKTIACKCPSLGIEADVERAYDIIVGKIKGEKEQSITCLSQTKGRRHEQYNSYKYYVEVGYSYKNQLAGEVEIHGGKGLGDCGATFAPGYNYLIVVFKCDKGYYTYRCSDNAFLPNASWQLNYLNKYFNVNYQPVKASIVIFIALLCLAIMLSSAIITFKFYKYRSRRSKNLSRII